MKNKNLRLIYPQWQGGVIADWFPDLSSIDASQGYYLGAQLLNYLAPDNGQEVSEVPISLDSEDTETEQGIFARQAIIRQTKSALEILEQKQPDRIITLGGECSASVVPFTYLAGKYPEDVAIIWIDAHPDINLPGDSYTGYHAMALTACLGLGDKELLSLVPAKFDSSKAMIVGLRSLDEDAKKRFPTLGLKSLSPADVRDSSKNILEWLQSVNVSKVVIHFDLDVLDPLEIFAAVGKEPDGMKIKEVMRVINDIAQQYDIVGLTVAEHLPKVAIQLRNILNDLPILKR